MTRLSGCWLLCFNSTGAPLVGGGRRRRRVECLLESALGRVPRPLEFPPCPFGT